MLNSKKRISGKTKFQITLIVIALVAIFGYVIWDALAGGPITGFLSDQSAIDEWVHQLGPLAPMGFVLLQMLQTILAPIPGAVTGLAGGYIFGWWGVVLTLIGSSLGAAVIFWLSKCYGRPLIERIFKPSAIAKFDFIAGEHASIILFLIFLLPCFPDDMVCYIGGLTDLSIKKLLFLVTVGHLPSFIVTNYMGMNIGDNNLVLVAVVAAAAVLFIGAIYYFRESITARLKAIGDKDKNEQD